MHHTHFNSIQSTQVYLKENLGKLQKEDQNVLISTSLQTAGIGRHHHAWDFYTRSLAMSFTLKPHLVPTLTPIEVGILCIEFFKQNYKVNIKMKWPNDLMTEEGFKCGGILSQYINNETVVSGVGLNIGIPENTSEKSKSYKHGFGHVDDIMLLEKNPKVLAFELYQYILNHRISSSEKLIEMFDEFCSHLNKKVRIDDDQTMIDCVFRGIGGQGEALAECEGTLRSFYSSSLTVME